MSLKEKFENHPAIWGASLFGAGFILALALTSQFGAFSQAHTVEYTHSTEASLAISAQVQELTAKHNERLAELQKKLLENEYQSTYGGNIESGKQEHMRAADRIRASIKEENESYVRQLEQLALILRQG